MMKLTMKILEHNFAICKLDKQASIPHWLLRKEFVSITRTKEELSFVCDENELGDHLDELEAAQVYKSWKGLMVEGPLDFSLIGILSTLTETLANAKISTFAISTFDTDYIFVKSEMLQQAVEALTLKGINIL